jgi:ATP-dependent Clp protease adapter protein ClpS
MFTNASVVLPEQEDRIEERQGGSGYLVIVYDNDKNTWDEVTTILQKATGCTLEEAEIETWEVDNLGKSVVHHGGKEECNRAAGIIRTIGIRVEVVEE